MKKKIFGTKSRSSKRHINILYELLETTKKIADISYEWKRRLLQKNFEEFYLKEFLDCGISIELRTVQYEPGRLLWLLTFDQGQYPIISFDRKIYAEDWLLTKGLNLKEIENNLKKV